MNKGLLRRCKLGFIGAIVRKKYKGPTIARKAQK